MTVLLMIDEKVEVIDGMDGFIELVDRYMGFDAMRWLEENASDAEEAWAYAEDLDKRYEKMADAADDLVYALRHDGKDIDALVEKLKKEVG